MECDCHGHRNIFREVLDRCAAHPECGRVSFLIISRRTSHSRLTLDVSEERRKWTDIYSSPFECWPWAIANTAGRMVNKTNIFLVLTGQHSSQGDTYWLRLGSPEANLSSFKFLNANDLFEWWFQEIGVCENETKKRRCVYPAGYHCHWLRLNPAGEL